jgi:hypothetical protein
MPNRLVPEAARCDQHLTQYSRGFLEGLFNASSTLFSGETPPPRPILQFVKSARVLCCACSVLCSAKVSFVSSGSANRRSS